MKTALSWFIVLMTMMIALSAMFYAYNNYSFSFTLTNNKTFQTIINKTSNDIEWMAATEIADLNLFIPDEDSPVENTFTYYKIGDIIDGKYENSELILLKESFWFDSFSRFIKKEDGTIILLNKYSDDNVDKNNKKYSIDETFNIPQLNFPGIIKGPSGTKFTLISDNPLFFKLNNIKKVFTHSKLGDVYTTKETIFNDLSNFQSNDFYIKAIDNTTITYSLDLKLFPKDCKSETCPIEIIWNNGNKTTNDYNRYFFNNDFMALGSYILDEADKNILIETGKTSNGETIYELAMDDRLLQDAYENTYVVYDAKFGKLSYQEYYNEHPIIVWEDSLGRLLILEDLKYVSPGSGMGI